MMSRIGMIALLLAALAVSACNTIEGVGEDISSVGRAGKN